MSKKFDLESRKQYYMENLGIKEEEAKELARRDLFDLEFDWNAYSDLKEEDDEK